MNTYRKIRDFHGSRAKGVGSSDISTLAGYTQRWGRTTRTLWEEKTGRRKPFDGNHSTHWGNKHEAMVLHEWIMTHYGEDTANRFLHSYLRGRSDGPFMVRTEAFHPDYRFALAHADLLVHGQLPITCPSCQSKDIYPGGDEYQCTGGCGTEIVVPEGWIVEAKSHRFFGAIRGDDEDSGYDPKDRSQNGIPASEFLQVQWQGFVYDIPFGTLCTLIDTSDYREYGPIKGDPRVQEKMLALAERFWWHVETDTPPKPETWDDVALMWPKPRDTVSMYSLDTVLTERRFLDREGNEVTIEGTLLDMLTEREKLVAGVKRSNSRIDEIKVATGILMGDNKHLSTPEGQTLATRVQTTRETVSTSEVEAKAPDLWKQLKDGGFVSKSTSDYPRYRKVKR
ncbi:MAG: YqaJ viral recombinase family protein [Spirochaetota bacterium]